MRKTDKMTKISDRDRDLMVLLARTRCLTVEQLAVGLGGNREALAKRVRALEKAGYLASYAMGKGRRRGRPEKLVSLGEAGVVALRLGELIPETADEAHLMFPRRMLVPHMVLQNWVIVQWAMLARKVPFLTTYWITFDSPAAAVGRDGSPILPDRARVDSKRHALLKPDAVLGVHHQELQRSLLFFLEVDRGTEDLANPDLADGDVRRKVLWYQAHFRDGGYKKYEEVWGLRFNGFRAIFVAATWTRLIRLCELVCEMPPSGFIWLTDQARVLDAGLWGPVWARGGKTGSGNEWLLGSQGPGIQSLLRPDPGP